MAKHQGVKRRKSLRAARRTALKTTGVVATSGILISKWHSPIVDSIILPSHAQTTMQTRTYWGYKLTATGVEDIVPPLVTACVEVTGDMATVTLQGDSNIGRRRGTIPTDGTSGDAVIIASSPDCDAPGTKQISITSISDASITIAFRSGTEGYDVTVFAGTCGSFDTPLVCKTKKKVGKKVGARTTPRRHTKFV